MSTNLTPAKYEGLISDIRIFIDSKKQREPDEIVCGIITEVDKFDNILSIELKHNFIFETGSLVLVDRKIGSIIDSYRLNIKIRLDNVSNFIISNQIEIDTRFINIILNRLDKTISLIENDELEYSQIKVLDSIIGEIQPSYRNIPLNLPDHLNSSQKNAIKRSLEAKNFHLIVGPPGTGKSHVIIALINELLKQNKKILITAYTNVAVDNLLERLDPNISDDLVLRVGSNRKTSPRLARYTFQEKRKLHPDWEIIEEIDKSITDGYRILKELNKVKMNINYIDISSFNRKINDTQVQIDVNCEKISKYQEILDKNSVTVNTNRESEIIEKVKRLNRLSRKNYTYAKEILELNQVEHDLPDPDHYYKLESDIKEMNNQSILKRVNFIFKPKENQRFKEELNIKLASHRKIELEYDKYYRILDHLEKKYKSDPSLISLDAEYKILDILDDYISENIGLMKRNLDSETKNLLDRGYHQYIKILEKNNQLLSMDIKCQKNEIYLKTRKKEKIIEKIENIRDTIEERKEERKILTDLIDIEILDKSKLIAATVLSSANYILDKKIFDVVIMDESSQVASYISLLPLLKGNKFILVGDDKQLQPIEESDLSKELNLSIFNKLKDQYSESYTFLDTQYRMNEKIAEISSKLFYEGKLKTYEGIAGRLLECRLDYETSVLVDPQTPITFIDTKDVKYHEEGIGDGCENSGEAQIVTQIVNELLNIIEPELIGVITPYRKQRNMIIKLLDKSEIEVDTVHAYQGREKDVIIISFCKSVIGRLNPYKKRFIEKHTQLNVAITRARKKLIIIGNTKTLKQIGIIREIINCIENDSIIEYQDLLNK